MQQLNCPNCGEPIAAENINIQKMVAVCSACNTVFPFDTPTAKAKRRKVKQPQQLSLRDTEDKLEMAFRTNFRLDKNENFLGLATVASMISFISLLLISKAMAGGTTSLLVTAGFVILSLSLFYALGLIVYNKTYIEMDEETIKVYRKPLYNLQGINELILSGAIAIRCEETPISKKEGYDTPRYRVWVEMADGRQRTIVNDVTEDYAYFISQRMDERLHVHTDPDMSRLEDHEHDVEYSEDSEIIRENTKSIFLEG